MEIFQQFLNETWAILLELSPALLLGLALAGLLHIFLPAGLISRMLSGSNTRSVMNAVLLGVPMPLCSCGVVPTAIGLRNDGASRGAATGFLISTPQTGVDSILVSASFLGWPFALFKVAAAFVTGLLGGWLVNLTEPKQSADVEIKTEALTTRKESKVREFLRYVVFDMLGAIDLWIVMGVILAALITLLFPAGYLEDVSWTQGIGGMFLMLLVALPLYVCTTSSVPIAASLIAAGLPLGAALVFLMAGPATNIATLGMVYRALGGRVLAIYLSVVAGMSLLLGIFFNQIIAPATESVMMPHVHGADWLSIASALLVIALLVFLIARRVATRISMTQNLKLEGDDMEKTLKVKGMTCQHCVATVKRTLEGAEGVSEASPDLSSGLVKIEGDDLNMNELALLVEKAGYQVERS